MRSVHQIGLTPAETRVSKARMDALSDSPYLLFARQFSKRCNRMIRHHIIELPYQFDRPNHVECAFWIFFKFIVQNALASVERILETDTLPFEACELLGGKCSTNRISTTLPRTEMTTPWDLRFTDFCSSMFSSFSTTEPKNETWYKEKNLERKLSNSIWIS